MNKLALAGALAIASVLAMPAANARTEQTGEEKLAKLLKGREAGEPVNCISLSQSRNSTVIDKTAIVYRIGGTLYVNRPKNAEQLDDDDILVTRTSGSQLCRLDAVQLHDRYAGNMWNGFVGLEEFVPYRKVAKAN